jgi:hypothetical protein
VTSYPDPRSSFSSSLIRLDGGTDFGGLAWRMTANAPETERNVTQLDAVPWWSVSFRKLTEAVGTVVTGRVAVQPPGGGVAPRIP